MMTRLGLEQPEQLLQYYPFELSGGMAQRVAFILSLIRNPQCLILDEPTSALDVQNRTKFMQQLMHIISERKMTVIFVTHDLSLVKITLRMSVLCNMVKLLKVGRRNR